MAAIYSRDYAKAYALISAADREHKPREEYLQETGSFTGFTLGLARRLASHIEHREIQTNIQGDRATVTVVGFIELTQPGGSNDE